MNGRRLTVRFRNNSSLSGTVCLYHDEAEGSPGTQPVAWLTEYAFPTTQVDLSWREEHCFIWQATRFEEPGLEVATSQVWPTDLRTNNQVSLSFRNGVYTFEHATRGSFSGSLYIRLDETLPLDHGWVGYGIAGRASRLVPALPNLDLVFTPRPRYRIAFGHFAEGRILDSRRVLTQASLVFLPNTCCLAVSLDRDNTWTVEPMAE